MRLTVDACVFVSAFVQADPFHMDSHALLNHLRTGGARPFCPSLALVETSAGIARPLGDIPLALRAVRTIEVLPGIEWIALDVMLARRMATLANDHRLRGADAVYLAVAERHNETLITWDAEMLQRGPAVLATLTPTDWLAANT